MKILVAGVGNVFLGDDGFGVEVARRLAGVELPEGVDVGDFGIRGIHLAYELSAYDTTILLDATPRGEPPGTLYVLELEEGVPQSLIDAHGMTPDAVLDLVGVVGGTAGRVLLVGCEPADVSPGMELSRSVADAVEPAVRMVRELIEEEIDAGAEKKTDGRAGGGRLRKDGERAVHEIGIAESILAAIEKRADGRPVRRARVRAGAFLRIVDASMDQAFELVTAGSVAEGAALDLIVTPGRLTCRACRRTDGTADPLATCSFCGSGDVDVSGGDELLLESIEIAEARHVPGNPGGDRGDPPRSA